MTATANQGFLVVAQTSDAPPRVNQGVLIAAVSFTPPNSPPQVNQAVLVAAVRQIPRSLYLEIGPRIDLPCIATCYGVPLFTRNISDEYSTIEETERNRLANEPRYAWRVAVGAGQTEEYPDPDAACRRMHQRYNPGARYDGFEYTYNGNALCKWTGPGTAPTVIMRVRKD